MQSELKLVKEFRRKRGQMQKELDEVNFSHQIILRDHHRKKLRSSLCSC